MKRIIRLFVLLAAFYAPLTAQDLRAAQGNGARPSVAFFLVRDNPNDAWTISLQTYAEAAAKDLGLDLEIHHSTSGRQEIRRAVDGRLAQSPLPDYALIINNRGVAEELLRLFNEREIYAFLFNAGLAPEERQRLGAPGERLPYWIGELTPDDEEAGYRLAKYLIAHARARSEDPQDAINMVGITGSYANPVAVARVDGLKRAVKEDPQAVLLQTVSARWSPVLAARKYEWLAKRYDRIDVVWAANDQMATGVTARLDGPTRPVVGGMDWTPEARDAIREGEMAASMGGHFIDVAYALAEIAAHARRNAPEKPAVSPARKSSLSLLTQGDLARHASLFDERRIDAFDFAALLESAGTRGARREISIDAFMRSQNRGAQQ